MVKLYKYSKYVEYAKTLEVLSRLTKNKFTIDPVDEIKGFEKITKHEPYGVTKNVTGLLIYLGINKWEITYKIGHEDVLPHEFCHVVDSVGAYKQTSLKKEFRDIAEDYKDGFIDYEKKRYRMSYPPVIDEIRYQTRNAECFARLLNNWAYQTGLINISPMRESDGDTFATKYYLKNKEKIDKYFNELFADEIEEMIEDGLVDNFAYESSKLTELSKTNNLSL